MTATDESWNDTSTNITRLKTNPVERSVHSILFLLRPALNGFDMGSFPQQFFSLTIASLCISGIGMVFGGLAIDLSPIVWLIPVVIALTFIYNTFILLIGSSESYNSHRLYSASTTGMAYFLTFLWTISLASSIAITCLLLTNVIHFSEKNITIYMPILSGVSLLETLLLGYMAVRSHREMRKIKYRNKWKWRIDIKPANSYEWSLEKSSKNNVVPY